MKKFTKSFTITLGLITAVTAILMRVFSPESFDYALTMIGGVI